MGMAVRGGDAPRPAIRSAAEAYYGRPSGENLCLKSSPKMKMGVGLFHIYWFQLFMSTQGPSKSWGVDAPNRCTYSGYSLHTHPVCLDWGPGGVNPQSLNSTGLVRPDGCENRGNTIHRRVACTRQGGASHSSESDTGYTVQYIFMSDQIQNVNSNQKLTGKPVQGPPPNHPQGGGGALQNFENAKFF